MPNHRKSFELFGQLFSLTLMSMAALTSSGCATASSEEPGRANTRRGEADFRQPQSLDSLDGSNPESGVERFLERMRQKHGEVSDFGGKKFIFIDNRFPLCRTFRKGYYRIDNISLTDKLEMLDIFIQMKKHLENLDDILKEPENEEGITRGMLRMNQWADHGRNLERRLHSILGVN